MKNKSDYFVGIDFGRTKTRCAVFSHNHYPFSNFKGIEDDQLRLFDLFELKSPESSMIDVNWYKESLRRVCEQLCSKKIKLLSATVNLASDSFRTINKTEKHKKFLDFLSFKKDDFYRLNRKSFKAKISKNEKAVEFHNLFYDVDGECMDQPKNTKGKCLQAHNTIVATDVTDYVKLHSAFRETNLQLENTLNSGSATSFLVPYRDVSPGSFSLMVDLGESSTRISALSNKGIVVVSTFPFGGRDITKIIEREFHLSFDEAESLKRNEFGYYMQASGGFNDKKSKRFVSLINQEIKGMLQCMNNFLLFKGVFPKKIEKIYLSGGGAQLSGLTEIFRNFFQSEVYVSGYEGYKYFKSSCLQPETSCAIGLAYYSFLQRKKRSKLENVKRKKVFTGYWRSLLLED